MIIVDDFSATVFPWRFTETTVGLTLLADQGADGVLGVHRAITLHVQSLQRPGVDAVTIAILPSDGLFDYSSSAGADGQFALTYAGDSGDLGLDLASQTAVEIDFAFFDPADGLPTSVNVGLNDGTFSAVGMATLTASGAQTLRIDFSTFAGIDALDLTSINLISFGFDGGEQAAMRIGEIRIVPAPAAVAALASAALAGLCPRRCNRSLGST